MGKQVMLGMRVGRAHRRQAAALRACRCCATGRVQRGPSCSASRVLEGQDLLPRKHLGLVGAAKVAVCRGVDVTARSRARNSVSDLPPTHIAHSHKRRTPATRQRSLLQQSVTQALLLLSPVTATLEVQGLANHSGAEVKGGLHLQGRQGGRGGREGAGQAAIEQDQGAALAKVWPQHRPCAEAWRAVGRGTSCHSRRCQTLRTQPDSSPQQALCAASQHTPHQPGPCL